MLRSARSVPAPTACRLTVACLVVVQVAASATAVAVDSAVPYKARPLPLSDVRLTGGPLAVAQEATAKYLLGLEPDRMLHFFRVRAGIDSEAEPYGGWDGDGRQLTGHIAGHYLSAVSLMFAATGDERFRQRAEYIVDALKEVQDAHGDGYLCALAEGRPCFEAVSRGEIRSGGFDLNGQWAPWYTLHKLYAGLRDAYRHTGNETALAVETRMAEWAAGILEPLNKEQIQQMLATEFGGMNEVLVDLYADTGDRRWLDLSYKFEHTAIVGPLKERVDILPNKHGNTQVPKLIGSADRYHYVGQADDGVAARFFWERVAHHHSYATGGHGKDEYFGPPDILGARIHGRTAESCNIYNMLKLTRVLFALEPHAEYAEFHERALFNHVLGAIDPEDGATCYMVPVGMGVEREYADMLRHFTCCVGSGMESHALHGDGLYYESGDKLWVNLYAPSLAEWKARGVRLEMATDFPLGEAAELKLSMESPQRFTLAVRRPSWAGEGFVALLNGERVTAIAEPGRYVEMTREWRNGDTVTLALPKRLGMEPTPDNQQRVALKWGPMVLAGDLGEATRGRGQDGDAGARQPPVFVVDDQPVEDWVQPLSDQTAVFSTAASVGRDSQGRPESIQLEPFYRLQRRRYAAYFDVFTPSQWREREAQIAAERERLRKLELATVAYVQPGQQQPENDYNYQSEGRIFVRRVGERPGRAGFGSFSFDVPVEADKAISLVITYGAMEGRRGRSRFAVLVDGERLAEQQIERETEPRLFDVEYKLSPSLVEDKDRVTVRFESQGRRSLAGPVFGIRTIRRDDP